MAISKVTLNGATLMDVTQKTVTAGTMLNGATALKNDGTDITGNISSKSSSDLTASGATVTAPAGYYALAATKSVASGTEGTPVATKGSAKIGSWELGAISVNGAESSSSTRMRTNGYIELTNQIDISTTGTAQFSVRAYKADYSFVQTDIAWHSGTINVDAFLQTYSSYSQIKYIRFNARYSTDATVVVSELEQLITVTDHTLSVTPSVTNSAGYISGGTHTGSSVSVTASELVSGTKTITQNGLIDVANYASVLIGDIVITGTFTGTTGGSSSDVSIPYTGSGYPIALIICPTEGPYNSSTGSYYNLLSYCATAIFVGVKAEIDVAPQYGSNISANHMIVMHRYKSSTSNATQYSIQQGTSYMYSNTDATSGGISVVRLKTTTTMSVYFSSGSGTNYGFAPNIEYTYYIVYSS